MKGELFSQDMVKAFLENRKGRTSRPVKKCSWPYMLSQKETTFFRMVNTNGYYQAGFAQFKNGGYSILADPKYRPGNIMYVREKVYIYGYWIKNGLSKSGKQKYKFVAGLKKPFYYAENPPEHICRGKTESGYYLRPSMFMPREAARIFLEVTRNGAQNIADMTEQDAVEDGFINDAQAFLLGSDRSGKFALERFKAFWLAQYGTDAQWMWVYYIKQISREEALKDGKN